MGYTTDFEGRIELDKPLTQEHIDFLELLNYERHDDNIMYGSKTSDYPGIWCQWCPTEDGRYLQHDGGEKFYEYIAWMEYIINKCIIPWGYVANGEIKWRGEEFADIGIIKVTDNKVNTKELS